MVNCGFEHWFSGCDISVVGGTVILRHIILSDSSVYDNMFLPMFVK